jgi:hypothetical protein
MIYTSASPHYIVEISIAVKWSDTLNDLGSEPKEAAKDDELGKAMVQ